MDLGLRGKRALVTGASSGLGLATALQLAKEGCEVTINSRTESRLAAAAKTIEQESGKRPRTLVGDIGVEADRASILNALRGPDGQTGVDIFIFNNGGPPAGLFVNQPPENWEAGYQIILKSAVELTRGLIDGMAARNWGRLLYVTSIAALQPIDDLILSNTYRAGIHGFCKTISNTYAKHGITANCLCPGYTATARLTELAEKRAAASGVSVEQQLKSFASSIPAGRLGTPEEFGALAAFLASESAAFITGVSIPIDGGTNKALI